MKKAKTFKYILIILVVLPLFLFGCETKKYTVSFDTQGGN